MRSRCVLRGVFAGVVAVSGWLVSPESVRADGVLVGIEGGAALEGPQGTIKGGGLAAVVLERRSSKALEFGLGFSFARDPGGGDFAEPRVTILALDLHGRKLFTDWRARPYLELGLGVYRIEAQATAPPTASSVKTAGGGSVGIGVAYAFSPSLGLRVATRYHAIAAEVSLLDSGNLEDYFQVSAAFVLAPRARA